MTAEEWLIAAIRIAGSLPVLRWALAGGLLAILVDFSDLFLKNYINLGGVGNYQRFDKVLDQVYMACFLVVALRWAPVPRTIAVVLYLYRMAGVVLFEIIDARSVLLFFPNVFEFWFIFVASLPHWRPRFRFAGRGLLVALVLLTAAKLFQEYALHETQWLDTFSTRDVIDQLPP